jgi:hypothetical protein
MMETWDRRDMWPFKLLIGVLALVLAWALFGSERLWVLNSRPMVVHRSDIRIPPEMTDLIGTLDGYGIHLRREPIKAEVALRNLLNLNGIAAPIDSFDHMTDPAMGYSVREWGLSGCRSATPPNMVRWPMSATIGARSTRRSTKRALPSSTPPMAAT